MTDVQAPTDYRLLLPDGWFRIDLSPERRERSVDALVKRQFNGVDDAPHLKRQARDELLGRAIKAYDNGGLELYLSLQQAGPMTIPASLLITFVPPQHPEGVPPEALMKYLTGNGPAGRHITVEELQSGHAVRVRARTVPAADDPTGNTLPTTSVDYHLPIPHSSAYLLLSFSTPLDPIADAMAGLFDAIAASLTWKR
ncbi:MAG: hypothetical protein JO362_16610 [Streptomycetaceae bacterium]|nr:hypothetical protein [Streptomycetaceae bacterium]